LSWDAHSCWSCCIGNFTHCHAWYYIRPYLQQRVCLFNLLCCSSPEPYMDMTSGSRWFLWLWSVHHHVWLSLTVVWLHCKTTSLKLIHWIYTKLHLLIMTIFFINGVCLQRKPGHFCFFDHVTVCGLTRQHNEITLLVKVKAFIMFIAITVYINCNFTLDCFWIPFLIWLGTYLCHHTYNSSITWILLPGMHISCNNWNWNCSKL